MLAKKKKKSSEFITKVWKQIYRLFFFIIFLIVLVKVKLGKKMTSNGPKLGRQFWEKDSEFQAYVHRMDEIGRSFLLPPEKIGNPHRSVRPPDENQLVATASDEWLDCCLKDFLERRKRFSSRYGTKKRYLLRLSLFTMIFVLVLYAIWPVWNIFTMFVAITTDDPLDEYYSVLNVSSSSSPSEIKKSYRDAVRKWHPDNNPNCGDYCKDQVIKVQKAHDVLLSRGDQRFVVANIESNRLNEIRSLILFRMYQMAAGSANHLSVVSSSISKKILGCKGNYSIYLRIACIVCTFSFFAVFELANFGASLLSLLQAIYPAASIIKPNATKIVEEREKKASYVDRNIETLCTVLPILLFYAGDGLLNFHGISGKKLVEMVYACLYVMGFLNRFTPNIRDNFRMRKCSLSLAYISPARVNLTFFSIVSTELGFLVDDLFAYTAGISFFPRMIVFTIHFIYLFQMFTLPLDLPISSRRARKYGKNDELSSTSDNIQSTRSHGERDQEKKGNTFLPVEPDACSTRPRPPEQPLSDEEIMMFLNLDAEKCIWLDIMSLKYAQFDPNKRRKTNVEQEAEKKNVMRVQVTSDLQNLAIINASKAPNGEFSILKLVKLIHDPEICRLLAIDGGSQALCQVKGGNQLLPVPENIYTALFGPLQQKLTNSEIWNQRIEVYQSSIFSVTHLCVIFGFFLTLLGMLVIGLPSPIIILQRTKELPITQRAFITNRFFPYVSESHALNKLNAGLLMIHKNRLLIVPDFWDAVRKIKK